MSKKTVSLVLGSGGARGLAHIGVIRYLQEHDYEIRSISGCSIGALIGGFYAAGKLDIYEKWIKEIAVFDMLKLLDFSGSGGLVSGEKIMKRLELMLGNPNIESLPITFTAVSADIESQKEIWINQGSLLKAIRASISLPMFFTPYDYQGKKLVDGGVLNPVPIAPTFGDINDLTIAVNLGAEVSDIALLENDTKTLTLSENIMNFFKAHNISDAIQNNYTIYTIADSSFNAMQSSMARMKLAAFPPDIELDIPRNLCGTFEFNKAKTIIEYGYKIAEQKLG